METIGSSLERERRSELVKSILNRESAGKTDDPEELEAAADPAVRAGREGMRKKLVTELNINLTKGNDADSKQPEGEE